MYGPRDYREIWTGSKRFLAGTPVRLPTGENSSMKQHHKDFLSMLSIQSLPINYYYSMSDYDLSIVQLFFLAPSGSIALFRASMHTREAAYCTSTTNLDT